ncbi:MAG: hypothetical protein ACTS4T_00010 [Candidatus Hodgkinia cicadicola]
MAEVIIILFWIYSSNVLWIKSFRITFTKRMTLSAVSYLRLMEGGFSDKLMYITGR